LTVVADVLGLPPASPLVDAVPPSPRIVLTPGASSAHPASIVTAARATLGQKMIRVPSCVLLR
jgi:hypothetical protein